MRGMEGAPYERENPAATRSSHERVLVIDDELVAAKARHAGKNPRGREIHILHRGDPDTLQRMLNACEPGSYIPPHRHVSPPKGETFLVLAGSMAFVTFESEGGAGEVPRDEAILVDPRRGAHGVDVREGVWHMYLALEPGTVVFEVKPGPYEPATDKEFAPWAPAEGTPEGRAFLAELEDRWRRAWSLPPRWWEK